MATITCSNAYYSVQKHLLKKVQMFAIQLQMEEIMGEINTNTEASKLKHILNLNSNQYNLTIDFYSYQVLLL